MVYEINYLGSKFLFSSLGEMYLCASHQVFIFGEKVWRRKLHDLKVDFFGLSTEKTLRYTIAVSLKGDIGPVSDDH